MAAELRKGGALTCSRSTGHSGWTHTHTRSPAGTRACAHTPRRARRGSDGTRPHTAFRSTLWGQASIIATPEPACGTPRPPSRARARASRLRRLGPSVSSPDSTSRAPPPWRDGVEMLGVTGHTSVWWVGPGHADTRASRVPLHWGGQEARGGSPSHPRSHGGRVPATQDGSTSKSRGDYWKYNL